MTLVGLGFRSSARRYHRRRARKRSFSCSAMESIELDENGDNLFSRHGFGAMERPGRRCYHQTVKMRTLPTVQQMIAQLTAIRDSLGALVHTSADGDLNTEEDPQTCAESALRGSARLLLACPSSARLYSCRANSQQFCNLFSSFNLAHLNLREMRFLFRDGVHTSSWVSAKLRGSHSEFLAAVLFVFLVCGRNIFSSLQVQRKRVAKPGP